MCLSLLHVLAVRHSELLVTTTTTTTTTTTAAAATTATAAAAAAFPVLRDAHCAVCRAFLMSFVKASRAISSGPVALTLRPSVPAITESCNKRF